MAPAEGNGSTKQRELQGWKEIADYLNRSVRTAQRWEREFELPVRRLRTAAGETVYAIAEELDDWKGRFTRREGFSGGPDEGDDSAAGGPSLLGDGGSLPEDSTAPAVPASPVVGRGAIRRRLLLVGASIFALALAALAMSLWASNRAPENPGGAVQPAAVLDAGPWPAQAHDMQRTNRSHLRGPRNATRASLLYRLRGDFVSTSDPIITMDGHLLLGWCGEIVGLTLDGREEWARPLLAVNGVAVHPSGFAASNSGSIYFTGADCLNTRDLIEARLYTITSTGLFGREQREIGSSYVAPVIGPDGSIYTLDEVTYLRAFRPWMDAAWGTTLGGFIGSGLAVDRNGMLYAGTDGGVTHEWSLWAVDQKGEIRWQRLKEIAGQPVVGPDLVYVLTYSGTLNAFRFDGSLRWSQYVGPVSSGQGVALGASGTVYVQTARDLVALNAGGGIKWRSGNGSALPHSHPVIDQDENIYLPQGDFVVSFTPDGAERWRVPVPDPLTLVLGDHRRIYVVSRERALYSIDEQ